MCVHGRKQFSSSFGGKLIGTWYAFGEYDLVSIAEFPDSVSVAATVLALTAGGALKAGKTTVLMTIDEGLKAMRKAGGADYRPPGG